MQTPTSLTISIATAWLLIASACTRQQRPDMQGSYKTLTISPSSTTIDESYTATLQGVQRVEIRPQVSGTITRICVAEGATVKRGQVLAIIDQVPYQAALDNALAEVRSAKARLASARLTLKSKQELRRAAVVADYDVEQAQNSVDEAEAALLNAQASETAARNNLSYTTVKSPADGVIGMIPYRVGALVGPDMQQPITTVADVGTIHAYFSISETRMLQYIAQYGSLSEAIRQMPAVRLRLADGTLYQEQGHIDAISGNIDTSTGAVSLRASFPNPAEQLRNGGTATVIIPHAMQGVTVIPQEATYELQDKHFVFKVVNGKTQSTEIGISDYDNGKQYIVTQGLKRGDIIVAEGAGLLHDGIEVNVSKR